MKLPGGDRAIVPIEKLRDYALDPHARDDGAKARVFRAALGLTLADVEVLRGILLYHARVEEVSSQRVDMFGTRFTLDARMGAFEGTVILRSVWIVESEGDPPRLITCYPLRRRGGRHV